MISCNPYLNFNGNCRTAIETYAAILGADIMAIMPHSEMPDPSQVPAEWQDGELTLQSLFHQVMWNLWIWLR